MRLSSSPHIQRTPSTLLSILLCIILILISGCAVKKEQLYSRDEAERKFIQICKEEYNWEINTKLVGNTLWIYLPYRRDIFKFKVNRFGRMSKCAVSYLNGNFSDRTFYFEYQIIPLLKSEEDKGYTYGLIDQVSQDFYSLLNVIYRVYFNAQHQPEFYVAVMADIVNGIEVIYKVYNEDIKKIYNQAIPQEEYYKRILQDIKGNTVIINDNTGGHLNYQELNLGQFLTEQIIQRIRIKFQSLDSELCNAPEDEILKIISYTLKTYDFHALLKVVLENLSSGMQITKYRWDLEEIKEF